MARKPLFAFLKTNEKIENGYRLIKALWRMFIKAGLTDSSQLGKVMAKALVEPNSTRPDATVRRHLNHDQL